MTIDNDDKNKIKVLRPGSSLAKVEVLSKLKRIYLYFNQGPINEKTENNLELQVGTCFDGKILKINTISNDKDILGSSFNFNLPQAISINYIQLSLNLETRTTILVTYQEKNQDENFLLDDIEELEAKVNKIWDAAFFKKVSAISCRNCQLVLIDTSKKDNPINLAASCSNVSENVDLSVYARQNYLEKDSKKENCDNSSTTEIDNLATAIKKIDLDSKEVEVEVEEKVLFNKLRNLPRQGWEELVDCWVCHKEQFNFNFGTGLTHPDIHTLLVSGNYISINFNLIKDSVKEKLKISQSPSMSEIVVSSKDVFQCPKCLDNLGKIQIDPFPDQPSLPQTTVKLYKLAISVHIEMGRQSDSELSTEQLSFELLLISDLLSCHRLNATSRFMIRSLETGKVSLLLWVVNWQVLDWINKNDNNNDLPLKLSHHLQVLFLNSSDEKAQPQLMNWYGDDSVQPLYYPSYHIDALISELSSKSLIPSSHPLAGQQFYEGFLAI